MTKPFVPTESELKKLGFEQMYYDGDHFIKSVNPNMRLVYSNTDECYVQHMKTFDSLRLYPKSLEELRLLISMMNQ